MSNVGKILILCLCTAAFLPHFARSQFPPHDEAPKIIIPLDKPVDVRLKDLNAKFASTFKADFQTQLDDAKKRVGSFTYWIGRIMIVFYMNIKGDPVMYDEMSSIADASGMDFADVAIFNYFYEASCTSIIGKAGDESTLIFGSNLDFDFAPFIRKYTYEGIYTKNDQTIFIGNGLYGMIGVLRGQRINNADNFAMALNERDVERANFIERLIFSNAHNICYFMRETLQLGTFDEALESITSTPLTSAAYYTIGGTYAKGGCVVERSAEAVHTKTCLGLKSDDWFLVQTNYDRDLPDPADDYRRVPIEQKISQNGKDNFTADYLLQIMSSEPTKRKSEDPYRTITSIVCQNFQDQRLTSTWLMYLWNDLGSVTLSESVKGIIKFNN